MKILSGVFLLVCLSGLYSCNNPSNDEDEVTIERQEDYNREDATGQETIPVKQDEELDLDN
jgi:hypothetical protein